MNRKLTLMMLAILLPWGKAQTTCESDIPDPLCAQDGADNEALLYALLDGAWHRSESKPVAPTVAQKTPTKTMPTPEQQKPKITPQQEKAQADKLQELEAALKNAYDAAGKISNDAAKTYEDKQKNKGLAIAEGILAGSLIAGGAVAEIHNRSIEASIALIIVAGTAACDAYRRLFIKNPELTALVEKQDDDFYAKMEEASEIERQLLKAAGKEKEAEQVVTLVRSTRSKAA